MKIYLIAVHDQIMSQSIGMSILDDVRLGPTMDRKLSDLGFKVGDLVTYSKWNSNSAGVVYRITAECPPRKDAKWGEFVRTIPNRGPSSRNGHRTRQQHMYGWVDAKGHYIPDVRVCGCIEMKPDLAMMCDARLTKKTVEFKMIKVYIKPVDIIKMGTFFVQFQDFMNSELKRLSGG